MSEQQPTPSPDELPPAASAEQAERATNGLWDPDEQVGDIYSVEVTDDGQIERGEKLAQTPRIWVGSWSDYNNGILHGQWIDANRDEDEIWTDIQQMLAASPTTRRTGEVAEEWGIFDHENFGSLRIGEQESVSWVSAVGRGIAEHGIAFAAYANVMQDEEALAGFTDDYIGSYNSLEAWVEELVDDAGYDALLDEAVPDSLRAYVRIDVEAMARDLQIGGDVHVLPAKEGRVWLFHAR